ncbi:MAG: redoxin domain-containing protein [Bacteriovoracaceae bacterium]
MKFFLTLLALLLTLTSFAVENGAIAPDFSLKGAAGKEVKLSDYKGKTVVLEWTNHGCPFVKKHYESGNMQALQKKYTEKKIVWLSIISSAEGKQGYVNEKEAAADKLKFNSGATDVLLDPKGVVGQMYEAKTTPHMFIISAEGKLLYQGAIDSINSTDKEDVAKAENYVSAALDSILDKKEIKAAKTKSYGCSVKY